MIGYPLDSQVTYEPDGTPIYDRAISSAPLRKLLHELFSDGVLPNPSTNLQVVVGDSGMTVKVNPGFAMVNGCLKLEETQRTLEIQAASSAYDRIDTIVVRLNDEANARICDLYVRQGTPASSPVRPDLVRSGSVYEIGLADVFIPRNTSTIAQQRITDTRYETARCGIISSISQFDTTTLYNQIQSDLAGFKTEEQQQFMDWFENLVYVLDGDVAGHLQNEIDATDARVDEIETQIGDTDISAIGDGKITGAISSLNSTLNNKNNWIELVGQSFIIPEVVQDFETNFTKATNYSNINITSDKHREYGIYMFKHSNTLDSYGIMFSRGLGSFGGAVLIKRRADGTWYFRYIL